jgi:alcohol dehydrogenase (cytochrome c)
MKTWLLTICLAAMPLAAQVTYEDILKGPSENWLTYAGDYKAQRHSPLKQITRENVGSLVPKWVHHIDTEGKLGASPLVYKGVMYVSNSNEVYALDARTGRVAWHYQQQGVEMQRSNRGVALWGDSVYFVTSDCYVVALDRRNGGLLWSQKYADEEKGYHCTMAPLAVKGRVIVGVSGGDSGMRGFLSARSAENGDELWRLWTVPAKGEPGWDTWGPKTLDWGGAGTWMTGTFDPELNTLYWPTGNPWPDFYGGDRPGDNLYSDSLLAIDPDTGKMKWYFQFTPHDVWDWDAQEFPVLLDLPYKGQPRKLVVHTNRNGIHYVLDRVSGEYLQATPFVEKITWAEGIDAKGRPILVPGTEPNKEGIEVCPTVRGAANWMSPSYNPETGLYYVVTLEGCDVYTSSEREPEPMVGFAGTGGERPPRDDNRFILRALDPATGKRVWQYPMTGPTTMWAGTVSTAGGVVFFGDDDNHIVGVDAKNGQHLWHFNLGQPLFASPISYSVDGKQYIAIVSRTDVFSFGLFEPAKPIPLVAETTGQ